MIATVDERRARVAAPESGTLRVHHLLESGDYVTREEYTPEQQEEIIEMLREAVRAGVRALEPAAAEWYDVRRVYRRNGA